MPEPYAEGAPLREGPLGEWAELRRLAVEYDKLKVVQGRLRARARAVVEAFEGKETMSGGDPRTPGEAWWNAVYTAIDALAAELEKA